MKISMAANEMIVVKIIISKGKLGIASEKGL
jgi:hypothetical protein